jgi:CHAT domain-containing protein
VLGRRGQRQWRPYVWRRRRLCSVVVAFLWIALGCRTVSDAEWRSRYDETRKKLWYGFFDDAFRDADESYRRAQGRSAVWSWKFQTLKAHALLFQRKPNEALALLQPEVPANLPAGVRARKRILQANALCRLGTLDKAKALLADDDNFPPSDDRVLGAELALTRGSCALSFDRATAKQYFAAAAGLARGSDEFIEAAALTNLGFALLREGSCEQAMDNSRAGLKVTASPFLRQKMLGNLGECYADLGDWKQSISFAEQAEKLAAQIKNADRETWLLDLGRAHLTLTELPEAERYYGQALVMARGLNDIDKIWRCLNNLTELALRRHDLNTAERYWKEESALNLETEGRAYVTVNAAEIAVERKDFAKAEQLFKEVLRSTPRDSVRLTAERDLGDVYWQENKIVEADQGFLQAIEDVEDRISKLPPEYRMSFLDEDPFYDSYVRFLVAQGRVLDALKIAERGRAQILSQATRYSQGRLSAFSLATVQSALKRRNQIALAYSLTNEESFVWVITPTQLKVFRLPSHVMLHPQVDAFSAEVDQHRRIEESPAGQELYKSLIGRIETPIPKDSSVVIVPSKILSLVSFESLVVPGPEPHYWIDDVEIESASSLALLAHPSPVGARSDKRTKELLLLGAPLEADKDFPTLKNAQEEMNRVSSHFPADQETVISGKEAIPPAYRASNPGEYRFIHIDAHSAASELNPLDSFVALSPTAGNSYKLFAHEITGTPLRADLVTLSACYGAGTRWYNGEGIVGLGWAFLRAGAHQVVASLWAVDDASTPQLMDDFYGELSKGKSAAEALRAAKLKMLHSDGQRNRPYYWASLQLYTGS